jgi:hypothetical protein
MLIKVTGLPVQYFCATGCTAPSAVGPCGEQSSKLKATAAEVGFATLSFPGIHRRYSWCQPSQAHHPPPGRQLDDLGRQCQPTAWGLPLKSTLSL